MADAAKVLIEVLADDVALLTEMVENETDHSLIGTVVANLAKRVEALRAQSDAKEAPHA